MNKAYLQAIKRTDIKKQTIESQRQWLKNVRNGCRNAEYIKNAYQIRLNELRVLSSHSTVGPPDPSTSSSKVNQELLQAADNCLLDRVKTLLAKGADVNARDNRAKRSSWPLSGGGSMPPRKVSAVMEVLIYEGADVRAKDLNGNTALKLAQSKGLSGIVELLQAHGAK